MLRIASRIGTAISYALVIASVLLAIFSLATCGPQITMSVVPQSQPVSFQLVPATQPFRLHLIHGEEDSSLARYRWALVAAALTAVPLIFIALVAWGSKPWHPFKRGDQ